MLKLLYKPVAIVAGIVGDLLSGLIVKRIWKVVGRGSDAPAPLDSERDWGEVLLASVLHGAIYALVKTAVDHGAAEWTRKQTGIWPDGTLQHPDRSSGRLTSRCGSASTTELTPLFEGERLVYDHATAEVPRLGMALQRP